MAVKDQQVPFASHVDERSGIAVNIEKLQAFNGDFFHGVINPEQPAANLYIPVKNLPAIFIDNFLSKQKGRPDLAPLLWIMR